MTESVTIIVPRRVRNINSERSDRGPVAHAGRRRAAATTDNGTISYSRTVAGDGGVAKTIFDNDNYETHTRACELPIVFIIIIILVIICGCNNNMLIGIYARIYAPYIYYCRRGQLSIIIVYYIINNNVYAIYTVVGLVRRRWRSRSGRRWRTRRR